MQKKAVKDNAKKSKILSAAANCFMADINLKLVRAIDAKHYDANIAQVDFAKMKDFLPKDESLTKPFFESVKFAYKKVIGINAFSNNKESIGFNFFPKHWLSLAYELALAYPEFLFVVLNFQKNAVQFRADELKNLRVFVNNDSIASLVSLSSRILLTTSLVSFFWSDTSTATKE